MWDILLLMLYSTSEKLLVSFINIRLPETV